MKLVKEIKSKLGELHFKRWKLFSLKKYNVYLHAIYKADEDLYLHNHPWDYTSIILYGTFVEKVRSNNLGEIVKYRYNHLHFGSVVKRKSNIFHKIVRLENNGTEKWGRILADVYCENVYINQWMIDNKFAAPYEGGTKDKNMD